MRSEAEVGWHKRFGGGHHGGRHQYGAQGFGAPPALYPPSTAPRLGRPKPILWILVFVVVALWSLAAWAAYTMADPFYGWVAASTGLLGDGAKSAATVAGAGSIAANLDVSGFLGQAIAFLQAVTKPVIWIVWAVGALALLAAPLIIPRIAPLLGRLRHH